MRHVAPHRWAAAAAGKLAERDVAAMERHAAGCRSCARTRERVSRASQAFPAIRAQTPPELAWDTVRARIHWSVSSERRAKFRGQDRGVAIVTWGAVIAGGLALGLSTGTLKPPRTHGKAPAVAVQRPAPPVAVAPAQVTGLVTRVSGEVMLDGLRRVDVFDRMIAAGTVLATADGRIDVQFGDASAFSLGPRSTLELHRFDAERIELAVEGTVDVVVAPRAQGQRFLVIAGDHTVEVRGTQFRVTHDPSGTHVACRHGLVDVRDARDEVAVAAARKVDVAVGHPIAGAHAVALSTEELAQLVHATPVATPLWTTADALAKSSAALEIATPGTREVRVDGIELGEAPLRVRVMPGRHTVEAADTAGRFRRAGWVDADPAHVAHLEVPAEAAPSADASERKKQFHTAIDQTRLARCVRAIAKSGLTETFVQIEISVDTAGAVRFLNVIDTDLGSQGASCVREVLADVRFGSGPAATWREKIDL